MKYDKKDFTYGVELEYADVYRFNKLPKGNSWNDKDTTIVNSSGIANDPLGKAWEYGGEINTKPTGSIKEQIKVIEKVNKVLKPEPKINYRCNLHIHVGVPGLNKDLKACKKLFKYICDYAEEGFSIVEPIPKPFFIDYKTKEAFDGAMKRYKRRLVSHHYMMPKARVKEIFAAKTLKGFYEGHAPLTKKGRMWYFSPRAGINLRQMFEETETIEFRHFPGTLNMDEMYSCILWCREFLYQALNKQKRPKEIYKEYKDEIWFPRFKKYSHKRELLYDLTNFGSNSRKVATANIKKIVEEGRLIK